MQWAEGGAITAVASRSAERAEVFGDRFDIPTRYDDYDALAADPDVDVVYVATPHSRHEVDTIAFLQAGKHVLCEKPLALNARQAARMAQEARSRGLFLMEAIWSRFLPAYRSLVDVIGEGRIGEPMLVEADFGFRRPVDPGHRHFARELGWRCAARPRDLPHPTLHARPGPDRARRGRWRGGRDRRRRGRSPHCCTTRHGRLGVVKAAIRVNLTCTARIAGTEGVIDLPAMMHCPNSLTVSSAAGRRAHRRVLRGKRAPLRNRRGTPMPGRGANRERGRPAGRVHRTGHDAGHHPRRTRRGVPRRMSDCVPAPTEAGRGPRRRRARPGRRGRPARP